ncbi:MULTISPECIES: CAP domain-containing protein [Cupriavidus]|uniref:CAP domain-containing protein n=1 Tax=Cupriavidus TaxID=106589 RepID=UPI001F0D07EB|nr:CAP domain-containing protein [Cupriavidus oxalaticus]
MADPTYSEGSGQLALFKGVNTLRQKLGVGLLAQDAALDAAAQAHAIYLSAHSVAQHDQTPGSPHFYEATPLLRAQKAGVEDSQWVAEVVGAARGPTDSEIAFGCIDQWYHTVYHLQSLVTNQESIGIGYSGTGALGLNHCVVDFGTSTATQPDPTPNGVPYGGGQQFDAGTFVTVPADGDIGVQGGFNFADESPNPAPDLLRPGRPLMVYSNGARGGAVRDGLQAGCQQRRRGGRAGSGVASCEGGWLKWCCRRVPAKQCGLPASVRAFG